MTFTIVPCSLRQQSTFGSRRLFVRSAAFIHSVLPVQLVISHRNSTWKHMCEKIELHKPTILKVTYQLTHGTFGSRRLSDSSAEIKNSKNHWTTNEVNKWWQIGKNDMFISPNLTAALSKAEAGTSVLCTFTQVHSDCHTCNT